MRFTRAHGFTSAYRMERQMNGHPYLQDQDLVIHHNATLMPTGASNLSFQLNLGVYQPFLVTLRPDLNSSTTFSFQSVDGGINPQNASLASAEGNYETQYIVRLASGVSTTFISVGPNRTDIIPYLAAMDQPTQALTARYCFDEFLLSLELPTVTSVGATTGTNPEAATTYPSGGSSNNFTMPLYQSAAVTEYLDTIGPLNAGRSNATSRPFPASLLKEQMLHSPSTELRTFGLEQVAQLQVSRALLLFERPSSSR
ncbi:hypothetical protein JAAARDRAFT_187423 [Jaapia argillacea MUCL 33604]|uniref:Uncharacterized protein n=1 Tax=Jaapia argillacea MUCL 33604 TaxID=933084 RepID=A0A067QD02_9AGAM|nr:hypothetical protein JAAARDRAFT_187423 [Jaapia argillacea MUCL 33604]